MCKMPVVEVGRPTETGRKKSMWPERLGRGPLEATCYSLICLLLSSYYEPKALPGMEG